MAELARPYEIYEWRDGKTEEWTILDWEEGELEIHPRDGRPPKMIIVLRIHVSPEEKAAFPHYWDLTSSRLVSQLLVVLKPPRAGPQKWKVTAIGSAPRTHFSVSPIPEVVT